MIHTDRNALLCDMAETYGVYDLGALPVSTVATLAAGLRDDSRIKIKMSGAKVPRNTLLLALIADRLSLLWWAKTKDGEKGRNRPHSLAAEFLGIDTAEKTTYKANAYSTADEFEAARAEMIERIQKGGA